MSIEKVKAYFNQYGMAGRVQEFEVSSATVELAAQALILFSLKNIKKQEEKR